MFEDIIDYYDHTLKYDCDRFRKTVEIAFVDNPRLKAVIHSTKSRTKASDHLLDKLNRKQKAGVTITRDNIHSEITDLAGVRVLHLYPNQFKTIHEEIMHYVQVGEWYLGEAPKAYTWDPETKAMFEALNIHTELKDSYYTSVHYLVKPNSRPDCVCCEIQVRTLFEEIWGEIDHSINYPHKTGNVACQEQLRVLAKLVGTGTRLADSIYKCYEEYKDYEN